MNIQKALLVALLVAVLLGASGVFATASADDPICHKLPPAGPAPVSGDYIMQSGLMIMAVTHITEYHPLFFWVETDHIVAYANAEKTLMSPVQLSRCDLFRAVWQDGAMIKLQRVHYVPGMPSLSFNIPVYVGSGETFWVENKWLTEWGWGMSDLKDLR